MAGNRTDSRAYRLHAVTDLLLIATISFIAQATDFSYKQGRARLCGDSVQYVASAEALLDSEKDPHFEMRKPGYIFYLAVMLLAFGNMGWAAVTGHHVLLGLLPLAAYGLGRHVLGRWAGWLAAVLTIARLQSVVWGDRMMSEALFTCLFSFGLLVFVVGLSRSVPRRWMIGAGTLLGLAWLTRSTALPVVVVGAAAILITRRRDWRRAVASCACFLGPILACVFLECGLNQAHAGRFRPSNGTIGATILLQARHFVGLDLPDTPDTDKILSLLPERSRDDVYVASHLDVWVARYRAIHDVGMDDWEYDDLMGRVGWHALRSAPKVYIRSGLRLALCHLLRRPDGQALSRVRGERRTGPLIHPDALSETDWNTTWFAYYGLPHLTADESMATFNRMREAASQRAPFGGWAVWKALRYWKTKPVAEWSLAGLTWLGSIWPGLALLGCPFLGLNRKTCVILAVLYVLDAVLIGFMTPTTPRLQFIWIVTDTSLAAAFVMSLAVASRRCVSRHRSQVILDENAAGVETLRT